MGLRARSEFVDRQVSLVLLQRARCAVDEVSALRCSLVGLDGLSVKKQSIHLSSSFAALQGLTRTTLAGASRQPAPSMGFEPLRHMQQARSGSRELCTPATFRPQGLVTLSTIYSLAALSALFHADSVHGVLPFGAFSCPAVCRHSCRTSPRMSLPRICTRRSETNEG